MHVLLETPTGPYCRYHIYRDWSSSKAMEHIRPGLEEKMRSQNGTISRKILLTQRRISCPVLRLVLKERSGRPDGAEKRRLVKIKAFVRFRLHKWRSLLSERLFIPNPDRYVISFSDFVTAKVWFILLLYHSESVESLESTLLFNHRIILLNNPLKSTHKRLHQPWQPQSSTRLATSYVLPLAAMH